jgi:uncharacterized membrane protein YgdD (TMEM256/DUF423 family)
MNPARNARELEGSGNMRKWLIGGAVNGVLGVLGGAAAGHAAIPALVEGDAIVRMGEHYQFWHAAVLLALGAMPTGIMIGLLRWGGHCLLIGATGFGVAVQVAALGDVVWLLPIAWACFALLGAGWLLLLLGALRLRA